VMFIAGGGGRSECDGGKGEITEETR